MTLLTAYSQRVVCSVLLFMSSQFSWNSWFFRKKVNLSFFVGSFPNFTSFKTKKRKRGCLISYRRKTYFLCWPAAVSVYYIQGLLVAHISTTSNKHNSPPYYTYFYVSMGPPRPIQGFTSQESSHQPQYNICCSQLKLILPRPWKY